MHFLSSEIKILKFFLISLFYVFINLPRISCMHPLEFHVRSLFNEGDLQESDFVFIGGKYFYKGEIPLSSIPVSNQSTKEYEIIKTPNSWFPQCMDHQGDPNCTEKWRQRYWINPSYYEIGGPIFFMFGGEGSAEGFVDIGIWQKYAKKLGALMICLEHRFYGKSFPTLDISYNSMSLLTSQQALEDAVVFLKWIKTEFQMEEAKIVAFGGSYPGNLAAWLRLKYPEIVNVAVASSAPLEARFQNHEYFQTVSDVINELDEKCYRKIRGAFTCMEKLVNVSSSGQKCSENGFSSNYTNWMQLFVPLHQCHQKNLTDELERQLFFHNLGARWGSNFPGHKNAHKCILLDQQMEKDVIDNYGSYLVASNSAPEKCPESPISFSKPSSTADHVLNFINKKKAVINEARNGLSWTWQTCYEFGYYQVASGIFSNEWDTLIDVRRCQLAFPDAGFREETIQSAVAKTNAFYGGKNYKGTCGIFVNGQWDPWHRLGLNDDDDLRKISSRNTIISIPQGEHCEDMQDSQNPSAFMIEAQEKILFQISTYLKDPQC